MKLSKRLLALLLGLALALSLALPALAEDDTPEEPNPAMPVITEQPVGGRVRIGQSITLRVQAHIPNGDEIEYRWYLYSWDAITQSSNEFTIVGNFPDSYDYHVEVINRTNPEYSVTSEAVRVEVYLSPFDQLKMKLIELCDKVIGILLFPIAPLIPLFLFIIIPFLMDPLAFIRNYLFR